MNLIFAPFAEIDRHAAIEWLVANQISQTDEVLVIRCPRKLKEICHPMRLHRLDFNSKPTKKDEVCRYCTIKSKAWDLHQSYKTAELKMDGTVPNFKELVSSLSENDKVDPTKVVLNELEIGAIAAYDLIISKKLTDGLVPNHLFSEFIALLEQCYRVYNEIIALHKLMGFKGLYVFDQFYSVNRAAVEATLNLGIPTYAFGIRPPTGGSVDHFFIDRIDNRIDIANTNIKLFDSQKLEVNSSELLLEGLQYLKERLGSMSLWVYSTPVGGSKSAYVKNFLSRNDSNPLKILITLRSGDERSAIDMSSGKRSDDGSALNGFALQHKWLTSVIDQLTTMNPDEILVVVRPHPRLYSNSRETHVSQGLLDTIEALNNLGESFFVDKPEYGTSVYDIISEVDLVINYSSSIGIDSVLLGVPTVLVGEHSVLSYPLAGNSIFIDYKDMTHKELLNIARKDLTFEKILILKWLYFVRRTTQINIRKSISGGDQKAILSPELHKDLIAELITKIKIAIPCLRLMYLFRAKNHINGMRIPRLKLSDDFKNLMAGITNGKFSTTAEFNFTNSTFDTHSLRQNDQVFIQHFDKMVLNILPKKIVSREQRD